MLPGQLRQKNIRGSMSLGIVIFDQGQLAIVLSADLRTKIFSLEKTDARNLWSFNRSLLNDVREIKDEI
jgi:hypothetical protein